MKQSIIMKEKEYFLEVGIASIGKEDLSDKERQKRMLDLIEDVEESLRKYFPKREITFCESILRDFYFGWTIGTVTESDHVLQALSKEYPDVDFAVKSIDNYGMEIRYIRGGNDEFFSEILFPESAVRPGKKK